MQTLKIYETDSYISNFTADVLSCEKNGKTFDVILDKTAFFPEGGGQLADTGKINGVTVLDVQIKNGVIVHKTKTEVQIGAAECSIDWDQRFRRMQNHSGEHILSGIAHEMFGCTNVGFHMGNEITVDFDVELSSEQISLIETKANEAVYKNVLVKVDFPEEKELSTLEYRSKLELTENVRIVTIEGFDVCACCAPHVSSTGEIGIIKVLSSMRHRGGTRLQIICGRDAFEDYCTKAANLYEIAVKLCAKHNHELDAFNKLCQENSDFKQKSVALNNELISLKVANPTVYNGITTYFEKSTDMQFVRNLVLESSKLHKGISAVFSGSDGNLKYAVASSDISVKPFNDLLRSEFSAKGGGSDELVQGNISASCAELIDFISKVTI